MKNRQITSNSIAKYSVVMLFTFYLLILLIQYLNYSVRIYKYIFYSVDGHSYSLFEVVLISNACTIMVFYVRWSLILRLNYLSPRFRCGQLPISRIFGLLQPQSTTSTYIRVIFNKAHPTYSEISSTASTTKELSS